MRIEMKQPCTILPQGGLVIKFAQQVGVYGGGKAGRPHQCELTKFICEQCALLSVYLTQTAPCRLSFGQLSFVRIASPGGSSLLMRVVPVQNVFESEKGL